MTQTVLILGPSGKIGRHSAAAFERAGWQVRRYTRGTDMTAAARGADVIVNGLNPPNYHNWAQNIPNITRQVIAAARASGATVIIPGNVYHFGDQGGVWDEATPQRPVAKKGQIRKEMEAAYRASGVRTIVLRAGNFIDPDRDGDVYSMLMVNKVAKGIVTSVGDPDAKQAYAYVPDWARAAAALAEMRDQLAVFEDIPFPGHTFKTREIKVLLEGALGRSLRLRQFPWWAVTLAAPFNEMMREFREMRYLFDTSHELGATKFNRLLPEFKMTDPQTVVRAGLAPDVDPDKAVRAGQASLLA